MTWYAAQVLIACRAFDEGVDVPEVAVAEYGAAPRMRAIAKRIGETGHFASFALAVFMTQMVCSIGETVDAFKERDARYRVEHIAGVNGAQKYRPPSCSTMKTHGLCMEDGRLCPYWIRNPL